MSKADKPTRAEIRARAERAAVPEARVYVFMFQDGNAQAWHSQVAFFSSSPKEAERRLLGFGITGQEVRIIAG
jgi:hypothetical protein